MTRHQRGIILVARLGRLLTTILLLGVRQDCLLPTAHAFAPAATRRPIQHLMPRQFQQDHVTPLSSNTRLQGVVSYTLAHIPHLNNQRSSTAIAGRLMPFLTKFRMGLHNMQDIGAAIVSVTDWQDVVLLAVLAFGMPVFAKYRKEILVTSTTDQDEPTTYGQLRRRFQIARLISHVSKVGLTVYAVDIVMVILTTMGFDFPRTWKVSAVFTRIAYSTWALREGLSLKRELICKFYKVQRHKMGRLEILDRFINGIAVFVYGLFLVDWLSLELGYALKSIFGLASVFSVAFTLASKDILSNLLSGIWLQASGKASPGDAVRFGDGTSGGLVKMGWLETSLRDGEGAMVKVPNAQLAGQKMSNLSEIKKAQVKQTLRFDYADADKIPELIQEIKQEIMKTCKKLVVDGSRPFRVHFTNYMEDHLEVTVVTHHNISPVSGEYHDNRQDLLLAINRAVKRCGMRFAQMVKVEIPGRAASWRVVPGKAYLEGLEGGDSGPNGEGSS